MKKLYIAALALMVLSWAVTLGFLCVLPEIMPLHLNPYVAGGVDWVGEKSWCMLFPTAVTGLGLLFLHEARRRGKSGDPDGEKALAMSSLPAMAIILLIGIFCMMSGAAG